MTDPAILARAVTGDRDARAQLVSEYYPSCFRFACRMLGDRFDAEDVVQETFFRALRALPNFNDRAPFRAWLFRILLNQCRTTGRQRVRRRRRFTADTDLVDRIPTTPGSTTVNDLDLIIAAVESLEPLLREAFLLKYVEEMDYAEMSVITGASISALKMRAKRACEALRPRLEAMRP